MGNPKSRGKRLIERLFGRCEITPEGCWVYAGAKNGFGYGVITVEQRTKSAHRVAYELVFGVIPDGLQLDHLCSNHGCIRPTHLEAVTQHTNILRQHYDPAKNVNATKTHCVHGHEFSLENTRVYTRSGRRTRVCITCQRANRQKRYRRLYVKRT